MSNRYPGLVDPGASRFNRMRYFPLVVFTAAVLATSLLLWNLSIGMEEGNHRTAAKPADMQAAVGATQPERLNGAGDSAIRTITPIALEERGMRGNRTAADLQRTSVERAWTSAKPQAAQARSVALSAERPQAFEEIRDSVDDLDEEDSEDEELPRLSISGWVLDEKGEPVSGIKVAVRARGPLPGAVEIPSGGSQQTTNADGLFQFQDLLPGEYALGTQATNRYGSATAVVRTGVDSIILIVTEAARPVFVSGIVDTQDEPLAGVRVLPSGHKTAVRTDSGGYYEFTLMLKGHNDQPVRFTREGYRAARLLIASSEIGASDEIRLDARLEPISAVTSVTGAVTETDGSPLHRASIRLYSPRLKRSYRAVSDRGGRFLFPEVEVGADYRLTARSAGQYKTYAESDLNIPEIGLSLAIELERLDQGILTGQMVDPKGIPVPHFSLWLANDHGRRPVMVRGDALGRFSVEEVPEGQLTLQTRSTPRLSVSGVEFYAGQTEDIRLPVDWGEHTLDGFVLDANERPVAGAEVTLLGAFDKDGVRSSSKRQTTTDANGYFLFTQLGSGGHMVTVTAPGYRGARLERDTSANPDEVLVRLADAIAGQASN